MPAQPSRSRRVGTDVVGTVLAAARREGPVDWPLLARQALA